MVTTAPLLLPWNTTTVPDGVYALRVLCATPAAALEAGPAELPATAGEGQRPRGSEGGGCSLRPGSGWSRAAALALLGNLGLPLAGLLALRLWRWRRPRLRRAEGVLTAPAQGHTTARTLTNGCNMGSQQARQCRGMRAESAQHCQSVPRLMGETSRYAPGNTLMWLSKVLTHCAAFWAALPTERCTRRPLGAPLSVRSALGLPCRPPGSDGSAIRGTAVSLRSSRGVRDRDRSGSRGSQALPPSSRAPRMQACGSYRLPG